MLRVPHRVSKTRTMAPMLRAACQCTQSGQHNSDDPYLIMDNVQLKEHARLDNLCQWPKDPPRRRR